MSDQIPSPAAQPVSAPLSEADDKQWASLAHLGGILGFLPSLIIWLIFKDRGHRVDVEGKEALNFQISAAIIQVANFVVGLILTAVTFGIWFVIQMLIAIGVVVVSLIFSIMGFVAVNNGGSYRYPINFRFIK